MPDKECDCGFICDESRTKVIVILANKRPHELMLIIASTILGILYLCGVPSPSSIDEVIRPQIVVVFWYLMLLVGGLIGIVASVWNKSVRSLVLERGSMRILGFAAGMYACAAFTSAGLAALGAGSFLTAWSVACIVRSFQITSELAHLKFGRKR